MSLSRRMEVLYLVLAVVGIVAAGVLSSFHVSAQSANAFCTGAGGCGAVKESAYSQVMGVPISFLGLLGYIAVAVLAVLSLRGSKVREWTPLAVFGIALSGTLYSLFLTYLELYVIHAVCPWCVASALVMVALLVISLTDLLWLRRGPIPADS